jgi:hypothetical protein
MGRDGQRSDVHRHGTTGRLKDVRVGAIARAQVGFSPDRRWITLIEPIESGSERLLTAPVDAVGGSPPSSQ